MLSMSDIVKFESSLVKKPDQYSRITSTEFKNNMCLFWTHSMIYKTAKIKVQID